MDQGLLDEDAGSSGGMVAAWASKMVFIAVLVRLLMHPLPGLLESLAYGGWVGGWVRGWVYGAPHSLQGAPLRTCCFHTSSI